MSTIAEIAGSTDETLQPLISTNIKTPNSPSKLITSTEEFLLNEDVDSQEESEDESDQEEIAKFFTLMNKAEKKNMKKTAIKQNQFGSKKSDWRSVTLGDPDEDTTDTEDEDDNQETKQFLTLMEKAKKKNTKVSIKWSNGQVKVERVQEGMEGEIVRREREKRALELERRKETYRRQQSCVDTPTRGKRKFGDRMSLNEAKLEDFDDTKDYVNFIQDKLRGVRIKIIK